MAARDEDFLGEGTVDPFAGLAPATPEDQQRLEDARRSQLRQSATRTSNINQAPGGYLDQRSQNQSNPQAAAPDNWSDYLLAGGILAAPALVTGAGALLGGAAGLGFGAGTGSIAAGNAGLAATESAAASAPAITTGGAVTGGTMAAPAAAGAVGTPAAGAAAGAAPSWLSEGGALGSKLAVAAAPVLINEALGGRTKEEKALVAKQEQLAREAQIRQGQQQDARMNQLGQQLLAFNPTNQRLAQMFGPSSAFTPDQMAGMVQGTPPPALPDNLVDYRGVDPAERAKVDEWIRRKKEFDAAEANRRNVMLSGTTPVGPGPAPIQMGAPQAARRF